MFEAHIARHHAHIARAMAIHERAVAAAERRVAYAMRAHLQAVDPIELIRAIKGRRKPPGGRPRRDLEGGDGVPAVPKPRPNPLAGAAAAPIE
jgi:hypothetical protein